MNIFARLGQSDVLEIFLCFLLFSCEYHSVKRLAVTTASEMRGHRFVDGLGDMFPIFFKAEGTVSVVFPYFWRGYKLKLLPCLDV